MILILLGLVDFTQAQGKFKFGTNVNPKGETFEVDSKGFIVNGERVLPVMGEIHYARVPEREWKREIQKMRAGGVTIVATYVFWIHHEEYEGQWDWSGNKNLRKFVEICKEENMPLVLRVGPFCHGECYYGGYASWIVEKAQVAPEYYGLSSEAPGFIDAVGKLYANIGKQVKGLLWKDGGPIVGIQLENECAGPWSYFKTLKKLALDAGFDVPFYTRTGWPKMYGAAEFGEILPLYGDYGDGFWDRSLEDMPGEYPSSFTMKDSRLSSVIATEVFGTNQDTKMENSDLSYPYLTCELGGGMMQSYLRRLNMSGREVKPLAICKLGSGSNLPGYYMYHGGTNAYNPLHSMGEMQDSKVTNWNDLPYMSYDFQTIFGEMGQPNSVSLHESRLLHQFLADFGDELSRMDVDTLSPNYARRGCFEFYNDYVRILKEEGQAYVIPYNMKFQGHVINKATVEPFCKIDNHIYFIEIKGKKPQITVDGKTYSLKLDKSRKIKNIVITAFSKAKAQTAYKLGNQIVFSDGLLYQDGERIIEEKWMLGDAYGVVCNKVKDAAPAKLPVMGHHGIVQQPATIDFRRAAVWNLEIDSSVAVTELENQFLQISYKGDVARVYADGNLVMDNFWNGKPFLVRLSDLVGKRVELRILPLHKEAKVYLQKEQKEQLKVAEGNSLLSFDGIKMLTRVADVYK